jgi:hypothetical protein
VFLSVCSILKKPALRWPVLITVGCVLVFIYREFNPEAILYFPKCPFMLLTGLECPGCGSQRAIHHLLNLEILPALKENTLMVIALPYITIGITLDSIRNASEKVSTIRQRFYGRYAMYISLFLILTFWIGRNLL